MNVSITLAMPWAIDKKTCGLVPNYDVDVVLVVNRFEEVRLSMLQEGTKRITGKRHWSCNVTLSYSILVTMQHRTCEGVKNPRRQNRASYY